MKLKAFILFSFVIVFLYGEAQNREIPVTIKQLLSDNRPIAELRCENIKYVNILDSPVRSFLQILIKTSRGLYVYVDGSGRLYQMINNNSSLEIQRMDSTVFFGYNLGSFPFVFHDTIYSLGGYGIWRINGQLRMYVDKANQWDIVGLNEEIPVLNDPNGSMIWYDMAGGKIYIGCSIERNQAVRSNSLSETNFQYDVAVLNLATKDWKKLGVLTPYLREKPALINNVTSSPWGLMVSFGNKLMIIDYSRNKLLYLKPEREETVHPILYTDPTTKLYYFRDSTLYFGSTANNHLDSIQFTLSDFLISDEKVYTPLQSTPTIEFPLNRYFLFTAGVVIVVTGGIWIWKKRKNATIKNMQSKDVSFVPVATNNPGNIENGNHAELLEQNSRQFTFPVNSNGEEFQSKNANVIGGPEKSIQNIFEEKEIQTLTLIYENSVKGMKTSIDDLNKALGVANKNNEIQKKQRSDTLKSINSKYSILSGKSDILIKSDRSEFDRRSFEYFIDKNDFEKVSEFFGG